MSESDEEVRLRAADRVVAVDGEKVIVTVGDLRAWCRLLDAARADGRREAMTGTPRPLDLWHEELGDVLWWRFPIDEPPYVGTPNDLGHTVEIITQDGIEPRVASRCNIGGWPGYHTHWTPIVIPEPPEGEVQP